MSRIVTQAITGFAECYAFYYDLVHNRLAGIGH